MDYKSPLVVLPGTFGLKIVDRVGATTKAEVERLFLCFSALSAVFLSRGGTAEG